MEADLINSERDRHIDQYRAYNFSEISVHEIERYPYQSFTYRICYMHMPIYINIHLDFRM